MNEYLVHFVDQGYACNAHELKVTDGEMRRIYTVKADKIHEAYYKAIELVRADTKDLVRLVYCKLKSDVVKGVVHDEEFTYHERT